jgi:hypothetical protein
MRPKLKFLEVFYQKYRATILLNKHRQQTNLQEYQSSPVKM